MKEVNKIIFDFMWKGKDKSDIEDGGLKAPHLDSIIETQRYFFAKKLASDQPHSWKTILLRYLKPMGGKFILCCNFDLKKFPIKLPTFYEECLKSFAKCFAHPSWVCKRARNKTKCLFLCCGNLETFVSDTKCF